MIPVIHNAMLTGKRTGIPYKPFLCLVFLKLISL